MKEKVPPSPRHWWLDHPLSIDGMSVEYDSREAFNLRKKQWDEPRYQNRRLAPDVDCVRCYGEQRLCPIADNKSWADWRLCPNAM